MKKASFIVIVGLLLFVSCGVKKGMMAENQRPEAQTLEQRVASGIIVDSVRMEKCSGYYSLLAQYDSNGQVLNRKYVDADSLILTPDGHYYKYKMRKIVDYGTFIVRGEPFHACMDFNVYDKDGNITAKSEPNGGIVECSLPNGEGDMVITMHSHIGEIKSFWIRRFLDRGGELHYRLIFVKDISIPGCWKVLTNSNVVIWI